MLTHVTATRFDKPTMNGKTNPCIIGAETADGIEVELIVKFAAGCEMKHRSLLTEAITAMLAADLDLPVPEPFLVKIEPDFVATIPEPAAKGRAQASLGWNFGSKKLPAGFSVYPTDKPIPTKLIPLAAEILAFDTFIANPDRTVKNPNLLYKSDELAIYDHELAFLMESVLFWKPPWEAGSITFPNSVVPPLRHIFLDGLRGASLDFSRFIGAFEAISPERLEAYRQALPQEWIGDGMALDRILAYIKELKAKLEPAINNLCGALK